MNASQRLALAAFKYGEGHARTRVSNDHARCEHLPDHYFIFRSASEGNRGSFAATKAANLLAQMVKGAAGQLAVAQATTANCERVQAWLEQSIASVSDGLLRASQGGALSSALASTCQSLLRLGDKFIYACVGPSSAYVLRNNQAYRLGPSRTGPPAPSETSILGATKAPKVHTRTIDILPGDIFFLCTPGLVPEVSAESILLRAVEKSVATGTGPKLLELARQRGALEDYSVLVIRTPTAPVGRPDAEASPSASGSRRAVTIAPTAADQLRSVPGPSVAPVSMPRVQPVASEAIQTPPPGPTRPAFGSRQAAPPDTAPVRGVSDSARPAPTTSSDGEEVMAEEVEQLSRLRIFGDFSFEQITRLAELCHRHIFHQGAIIVREGDRSDSLFVITSGKVAVRRGGQEIGRMLTGQPFGEDALLSRRPRTVTVEAQSLVRVLELTREDYDRLAVEDPTLVLRIVEKLSQNVCLRLENELNRRIPIHGDPRAPTH